MSANVETMFSVRETPWHGLGRIVMDAPASREALELADLDWQVESRNIYSGTGAMIPGYRANVRSTDDAVLGVVSDRYRIVQNEEAFQFTDDLLGEGVTYETAGSLQGGKKVWMLAKLPEKYIIAGDEVTPYLVFFNSHDGSSGVKVAMTPVRVVCQNTLNLALGTAKRSEKNVTPESRILSEKAQQSTQLAEEVGAYLQNNLNTHVTIQQLASMFHVSQTQLKTSFKERFGVPLYAYSRTLKMQAAAEKLCEENGTVLDVAGQFGYSNGSKFAKAFRDVMGMTPKEYRRAASRKTGEEREISRI